jgi:LuxR family maltose regulon positive regulatory protein
MLTPQARQEQENLLGEVIAYRAILQSYDEDGQSALTLCQQALTLLSADNFVFRTVVAQARLWACYVSSVNDAVAAVESGLQACSLAQTAGQLPFAIGAMGTTALHMLGTGQLHEAQRLTQQAMQLGTKSEELVLPEVGWPALWQAEILRERNQLDAALSLAEEAIELIQQTSSNTLLVYLFLGYAVRLHIFLSRRNYDAACSALRQIECINLRMNQPTSLFFYSFFTTVDQVRLWLACGGLDHAIRWAEELDLRERYGTPFAHEREEVAQARILLAKQEPVLALQRLESVLQRATAGQRWGHVIEMLILQALAYQMCQEATQALDALSEAVCLAKPEGYIRSFVDEGAPMETLLYRLRKRHRKSGLTPYLDTLLAAFQQESKARTQAKEFMKAQPLLEPLSKREREVLQLLEQGISNQEIAQELVIAYDTVKRHVNHIFSKLGVSNRVQAVMQARVLGLFDENPDIRKV